MQNTLSRRLATIAAGVQHAVDTGARLSPRDAKALHTDLLACAALAREIEATRARQIWHGVEPDPVMFAPTPQACLRHDPHDEVRA